MKNTIIHLFTTAVMCILALTLVRAQSIEIDCENFEYVDDPWYIYGVVTIDGEVAYNTDIIITPESELIVLGAIYFGEGTKLIVQRNAKLTIQGGLLTGACGFWLGVELHGTTNQPQDFLYQGWVHMYSGAVIEKAICGIRTIKTNGQTVEKGYAGGIIYAESSLFRDNLTSVSFYPYQYVSNSIFARCNFSTSNELPIGAIPDYFVRLDHINGVRFFKCNFGNQTEKPFFHDGLYAFNSTFHIEGIYTGTWEHGEFRNLNYGIYAVYTRNHLYPDIRHTEFPGNKKGIYISGTAAGRVTSNWFYIPLEEGEVQDFYGLFLNNCKFYHIEDNKFFGQDTLGGIGLYVNHSGTDWNQVYNNSFSKLYYGTIAYGVNRNQDGSLGLCIKCNDYEYNVNDICVNGDPGKGHGIAYNQGFMKPNDTTPAGNTFTLLDTILIYNYINSNGMGWINYVYHGNNPLNLKVNPDPYFSPVTMNTQSNLQTTYWNKESVCPSKLDSGGGGGYELIAMAGSDTEIAAIEAQLATLVDDGDTPLKTQAVMSASPLHSGDLYDDLMAGSPFLSDTVLKSAIYKEDVFPAAMVRDVLVANPQSAKSNDIIESLDYRWDQMPGWMMDQIMEGVDITGAKEAIEGNLAGWKHKRGEHFTNLYRHYLYNGIDPQAATDSIELLLSGDNSLNSKHGLAMLYAGKGDYASMNAVIGSITATFTLTSAGQAVHQDYTALCSILEQLDGNLPEVGTSQASALMLLAEEEEHFPGACARNLLIAAGLLEYQEPVILPDLTKSSKVRGGSYGKGQEPPDMLKVFPNPAKDFLVVDYNTDGKQGAILLTVTDMKGYTVHSEAPFAGRDQVVISTSGWKKGTCVVNLSVNGKPVASRKVNIQ
ncbi:MAG: hypothetical protein ACNA7V_04725 [Bacteroidales bacterium]